MKQLSFLLFILISFSASAQIKKMTSEDLLTGEIKTWIEVTDSVTKKVKVFNYSEQLPAWWNALNVKLNVAPIGGYKNTGYYFDWNTDSAKVNPGKNAKMWYSDGRKILEYNPFPFSSDTSDVIVKSPFSW